MKIQILNKCYLYLNYALGNSLTLCSMELGKGNITMRLSHLIVRGLDNALPSKIIAAYV